MSFAKVAFAFALLACTAVIAVAQGQEPAKSNAPTAKTQRMIYKPQPRRTLTVFYPDDWKASDKRPALVIFRCRIPVQREYFRKLGMVIIKPLLAPVNSGVLSELSLEKIAQLPKPRHQVEDAKSAIRFIRQNAAQLGVDPERIVATGTSGGGDLALQSHLNRAFEDSQDDTSVSASPNALVLYCPAFDGIDIWFVKTDTLVQRTKKEAPSFLPLLARFVRDTKNVYVTPLDHRAELIKRAGTVGAEKGIPKSEIESFQKILEVFNERDWQLLHPVEDALRMSASRILTRDPLPPTLIMFGDRDHLYKYQTAFVATARNKGQQFELKIFKGAGHSFMLQRAFVDASNRVVDEFLKKHAFLPQNMFQ